MFKCFFSVGLQHSLTSNCGAENKIRHWKQNQFIRPLSNPFGKKMAQPFKMQLEIIFWFVSFSSIFLFQHWCFLDTSMSTVLPSWGSYWFWADRLVTHTNMRLISTSLLCTRLLSRCRTPECWWLPKCEGCCRLSLYGSSLHSVSQGPYNWEASLELLGWLGSARSN